MMGEKQMDIKFSVIVPIYKVEQYVRKCIESILAQTYRKFELILVDDGSPDNCPAICEEYAKKDARIRVIHKRNQGLVAARNTGIEAATGEYICYVDGDDWVSPKLLETIWNKAICKHAPDMVVFSAVKQFDNHQEEIPQAVPEGLYSKEQLKKEIYPHMMYDSRKPFCTGLIFPVAWNKIFKTKILKKYYCKDTRIRMGEDNAFVFECLYRSNKVYFCKDILYFYNQLNGESMVHSYDCNRFANNKLLTKYIESQIGGEDKIIDEQINAFKAYWLIMAVFHEVKSKQPLVKAAKHIKTELRRNATVEGISLKGIPQNAKLFIVLLKLHLYMPTLILSIIVNKIRNISI